MSTYTDDVYDNDDDEQGPDIPGLRKQARKASRLEKENEQLRRQVAFATAGIPLTDPRMTYFVKGYDGELDADAIRAAATEAGFLTSGEQPPSTQDQQAVAAEQRLIATASGSEPFTPGTHEAALQSLEDAMRSGGVAAMLQQASTLGIRVDENAM